MKKDRELFADILRTFAIFCVVIIHTTANYFVQSYPGKEFNILLIISSITSCAVPLFYMLSGTFILRKKDISIKEALLKTMKLLFQVIFWSSIYLLIFKYILKQDINLFLSIFKSIFQSQVGHLWFVYPLIGLYILSPIISKVYHELNEKGKTYLILITYIIPVILSTIMIKAGDIISMPSFAIGFPEVGLFIYGKYLYDKNKKYKNKKLTILSFIGIILGIVLIIFTANYYINTIGISNSKPYFDYNKLPNVILITSIYIFTISIEKYLKKLPKAIKNIISIIGTNTGGIYFTHMLAMYLFPSIKLFKFYFTCNIGNLSNMLLGAILYFVIATLITLIFSKIPILKKII